jgi:hypothetical protein
VMVVGMRIRRRASSMVVYIPIGATSGLRTYYAVRAAVTGVAADQPPELGTCRNGGKHGSRM